LIGSGLSREEVQGNIKDLVQVLFANIPTGVGSARKDFKLSLKEQESVFKKGASWAVGRGFGDAEDLAHIEEGGCIPGGDPSLISKRALERGRPQLGTLGSGNHFVEIGFVKEVYDEGCAHAMGLYKDQVTIFVHTGSRGLGHQVCDDAIKMMLVASRKAPLLPLVVRFQPGWRPLSMEPWLPPWTWTTGPWGCLAILVFIGVILEAW